MPDNRPTVNLEFDPKLSDALNWYSKTVNLSVDEIVYRAVLCYWQSQHT